MSSRSLQAVSGIQTFNLVRWFLVLSLTSIVLTSVASAIALSNFLKRNILERDAIVTMEFVNTLVRGANAEAHLIASDPDVRSEILERLFERIASIPEVIRANLYGSNRVILWSSDPAFVGAVFRTNRELDHAFAGRFEYEEGVVGERKKAEHAFLEGTGTNFVENYLPIWNADRSAVIGVAEVYKAPERLYRAIDRGTRLIWWNAALGGLVLYIALAWIISRASRVMRQQQAQLADTQAMAAIGEVASAVAHGLRNPLATIRTSAEVALDDQPPPPIEEALRDIVAQSDRLEGWIRALLTTSRPESFELESVEINELLGRCVAGYAEQMKRQSIELDLRLDSSVAMVDANPVALSQVINSLLANAMEAMPDGGRLSVSSSCSTRRGARGRSIQITIVDTGQGISGDEMGRVFEPFVTTKGATGLGIGLPLARRIIERHCGRLDLRAGSEGGAIALIELPAKG